MPLSPTKIDFSSDLEKDTDTKKKKVCKRKGGRVERGEGRGGGGRGGGKGKRQGREECAFVMHILYCA